jgi:hypothetical protein
MDLMIESFNFRFGSLGSLRLLDLIPSGLLAGKTVVAATLGTSVGSSSEVNSPVSIKPTKSKRNTIEELDKIMENLDLKESSEYSDMALEENSDSISNYSEEDCTAHYGDVSYTSEDEWVVGFKLHNNE